MFSKSLHILFNSAISTNIFRICLKKVRVCSIRKAGSSNVLNCRPISFPNFSRVFEIILHNETYSSVKQFISSSQHGFMKIRFAPSNQ